MSDYAAAEPPVSSWTARVHPITTPLKRLLWGIEPGTETYVLMRWLFLRALSLIYLFAFISVAAQILGLNGSRGILPATDFLKSAQQVYPFADANRWINVPTLAWLNSGDAF